MKIAKSGGDNRVIDPGLYRVKCTSAVGENKPQDPFGKTKKVRITLKTTEVVNENGDAIELDRVVNQTFDPKGNLYPIFEAFGLPVTDEDYEPDTDDLLGKEANAVVVDYVSEGDGSQWSRVERLIALPKSGGTRQRVATAPQDGAQPPQDTRTPIRPIDQFWDNMTAAGLVRIDVVRESVSMFEKEPDELNDKQRETLEKVLLS